MAGKGTPGPAKGTRPSGRKKGTPNKVTSDVRNMVLEALSAAGGVSYLIEQAAENPKAFMTLVAKCMPTKIEGDINVTHQEVVSALVAGRDRLAKDRGDHVH